MIPEIVKEMSKKEQFEFFQKIRGFIPMSQAEIARMADVSVGLVSAVYNGVNQNKSVLEIIDINIADGWQDHIPNRVKMEVL